MTDPFYFPTDARALPEAVSNMRAAKEASAMVNVIEAVAAVLDMSDPDHEAFADSAADCLAALLALEPEIRRILDAVVEPSVQAMSAPAFRTTHASKSERTSLAATRPIIGPIG